MGMTNINLIPAPRRAAMFRRRHWRRCAAACAAWAALSLLAGGASHVVWRGADGRTDERLAKVAEEMRQTDHAIASVQAELATARAALRSNQAIANQPDWSILLALLGQKVGDGVVLKSCSVRPPSAGRGAGYGAARVDARRPAQPAPAARPAGDAGGFRLEVSGVARSHAAANDFVLRLESERTLFSKVTLLDTAREPFLDRDAIAFRLECSLDQSPLAAGGGAGGNVASAQGGD